MNKKAFTLVEISLYVALAVLICTGLLYFLLAISQSRTKTEGMNELQAAERVIFNELNRLTAQASSVNWNASQLDQDLGSLVLIDSDGQTRTLATDERGRLTVSGIGLESPLHNELVQVKRWRLSRLDDRTVTVKLELAYLEGVLPLAYSASWSSAFSIND